MFLRLKGVLTKQTCSELALFYKRLISSNQILFIVFNLEGLLDIDLKGVNLLLRFNQNLNIKRGRALFCGINNDFVRNRLLKTNLFEIKDELGALSIINL